MVSEKHKEWHRWFAWYPVRSIAPTPGVWLWMRRAERLYFDLENRWLHQTLGWNT